MLLTEDRQDILVIQVDIPKIDMLSASDFQHGFSRLIEGHDKLILLDLCKVDFMDSSGLAALVFCFQQTDLRRDLVLCGLNERLTRLLQLTRLMRILRVFPDRETALAELEKAES